MGRGKNQRKNQRFMDSDDDTLSTCSTGALSDRTFPPESEEEVTEDLLLDRYLEATYEKRGSTREGGLKGLISAFTNSLQFDFVETSHVTLLDQFVKAMKRGFPEVALAAHALGLLSITVGAGDISHKVLEDSISLFSRASKPGCDSSNLILVLQALAVITFVGGNEVEETEKSMDILWTRHIKVSKLEPTVRAAAISAWAFLLTTVPSRHIRGSFTEKCLPVLSSLLDAESRAVRIAAGEAIAVIFEAINSDETPGCWNKGFSDMDEHPNQTGSFSLRNMEKKILEQMKELSVEASGKGSSKKDLNVQKSSFRDFLASIEEGESPTTTVKLQNGFVLSLSSWTQTTQLNFLRHFLGGGFQKHMQTNSLLHEVFEFNPVQEKQNALSATQKRLLKSPNSAISKARTQHLNKQRAVKKEYHNVE
eukprot:TRINITY_DN1544_c0_g1_i1.p1 TRINITY_DN1544_c0_g1~~TRINITY_DN1544_c0_g1_i1.p1  ORF type:complete len:423 (-),score=97.49 TRINITY_DN1544_c0_g1_i1:242-1510(-)